MSNCYLSAGLPYQLVAHSVDAERASLLLRIVTAVKPKAMLSRLCLPLAPGYTRQWV